MRLRLVAFALMSASLLAACTVGPDYKRPAATTAATYKELEGTGWKTAEPADARIRSAWWEVYNDPDRKSVV